MIKGTPLEQKWALMHKVSSKVFVCCGGNNLRDAAWAKVKVVAQGEQHSANVLCRKQSGERCVRKGGRRSSSNWILCESVSTCGISISLGRLHSERWLLQWYLYAYTYTYMYGLQLHLTWCDMYVPSMTYSIFASWGWSWSLEHCCNCPDIFDKIAIDTITLTFLCPDFSNLIMIISVTWTSPQASLSLHHYRNHPDRLSLRSRDHFHILALIVMTSTCTTNILVLRDH